MSTLHECVFEWKYHTRGFLGRETDKTTVGFPDQENHECDISTQKTHSCRFLLITCH
jgi:hypothetical protein